MQERAYTILKIAVTLAGLAIVLSQVGLQELVATLLRAQWAWLLLTFLLFNASLVVRAYRWLLLIRGLSQAVPFLRLVELYFAGNFFNTFLPTSFGGDVLRAWEISEDVSSDVAAGTVVLDRLTGLLALLMMSLLALPFRPDSFPDALVAYVVALAVLGLLAGFLLLEGSVIRRFGGWLPGPLSPQGGGFVARTLDAVAACGRRAIVGALAVSFFFNLMLVGWWWTSARALDLDISYIYLLLVIPMLSVVLLIPSIGGLGPRELLAPILFAGTGATAGEAYALSLLVYIMQRVSSLLGGIWYLLATVQSGRRPRRKPRNKQSTSKTA